MEHFEKIKENFDIIKPTKVFILKDKPQMLEITVNGILVTGGKVLGEDVTGATYILDYIGKKITFVSDVSGAVVISYYKKIGGTDINIYDEVKKKVETILLQKEVYTGTLDVASIIASVLKELVITDLGISTRRVGEDLKHNIAGKLVLSLPASINKITSIKS